jgi:DNA-binding transcriptional MerR regulator
MDKISKFFVAGLIVILLVATFGIVFATGQINENFNQKENFLDRNQMCRPEPFRGNESRMIPFFYNLTEEQQTELNELINNLKNQGVNNSDIRKAIQEKLDEWGILDKQLDDEIAQTQKRLEILNREKELREQGYSWEEINQIIQDEYNLENPIFHNPDMMLEHGINRRPYGGPHGFKSGEEPKK